MIKEVSIKGYRSLDLQLELKRVNAIVGEYGSGKTTLLEAIALATAFRSYLGDKMINAYVYYIFASRNRPYLYFTKLGDAIVKIDDYTVTFEKEDSDVMKVYINGNEVATVDFSQIITSHVSTKAETELEGKETAYMSSQLEALYVPIDTGAGRGRFKYDMLKFSVQQKGTLLIDDFECSLLPQSANEIIEEIAKNKDIQVLLVTYSNEVVRKIANTFDDNDAQIIYMWSNGFRIYKPSDIKEFEKPFAWFGYV